MEETNPLPGVLRQGPPGRLSTTGNVSKKPSLGLPPDAPNPEPRGAGAAAAHAPSRTATRGKAEKWLAPGLPAALLLMGCHCVRPHHGPCPASRPGRSAPSGRLRLQHLCQVTCFAIVLPRCSEKPNKTYRSPPPPEPLGACGGSRACARAPGPSPRIFLVICAPGSEQPGHQAGG